MQNLNYIFFEEFKHLDKLCGEVYNSRHGVTSYIDDMKAVLRNGYQHIPNWKNDLEQLIRLRHIRNYLAHTTGAFQETLCTQKDIDLVIDFCNRILKQTDPMALLYKNKVKSESYFVPKSAQGYVQTPSDDMQFESRYDSQHLKHSKGFKGWGILLFGLALAAIILIVLIGAIYIH